MALLVLTLPQAWAEQPPAISSREGLPVVQWDEASQVVREVAVVCGKVVEVGGTANIQFLNFSRDRSAFKVVIFAKSLPNFEEPLEQLYQGKLVEVQGLVSLFKGGPQIVVTTPDQIRVVDRLASSWLPQRVAPTPGTEIKVATWNILNLFDSFDDPHTSDETTPEKPRGELESLAASIRELNADVLALQEVENRGYLQRFVDVFLREMGYRHVLLYEGNDLRGIDVALLSRFPVGTVTSHAFERFPEEQSGGATDRFQRDLLCVEVLPPGGVPFDVYVVHLKSAGVGDEDSAAIRLAEARAIQRILATRLANDPNDQFVICGDFNDVLESEPIQTILQSGNNRLSHFTDDVPTLGRVTYNQGPHQNMIDFIFASPGMADRYVRGSYAIRPGSVEDSGSDHNPVSARFQLRAAAGSHSAVRDALP